LYPSLPILFLISSEVILVSSNETLTLEVLNKTSEEKMPYVFFSIPSILAMQLGHEMVSN